MNLRSGVVCLAAIILIGSATPLAAQEPPPPPQAPPAAQEATPPAAEHPAAQPAKPTPPPARKWHGSFNFGLALAGGAQAQRGYQLDGSLSRQFSERGRFVANLSRQYQKVTFPSKAVLTDRVAGTVGADLSVTKHTVAMARSLYLRDLPLQVDSRFEQLIGYGLHLYTADKRYELYLIPGLSAFKQDLVYSEIRDWEAGIGFYEKFSAKLNKAWAAEQSFRFRENFTDEDHSIESIASLHGMFTKTLGLQLDYQYNLETIVPPGFPSYLQIFSAGLRFQF